MATVNLHPDFRELLKSLNSERVKYLLVGGYAVIHYGSRRATDDFDVWVSNDPENAQKVSRVLKSFGGFSDSQVKASKFEDNNAVFICGRPPVRIDVLTGPSGVTFDECYARRNEVEWDGIKVPLISLEDLKTNKRASGRPKDLADLEALPDPTAPAKTKRKRRR